jgi:hypothetical protein
LGRCNPAFAADIGRAVGSAIGGVLYARDLLYDAGYASMGFVALALVTVILTKPPRGTAPAGWGQACLIRNRDFRRVLFRWNFDPDQATRLDSWNALPYVGRQNRE